MFLNRKTKSRLLRLIALLVLPAVLAVPIRAQDKDDDSGGDRYPNTSAKDMDADMPWRVENADTAIPVIWMIKDSDQWLVEVDELKYVVVYDVSDGYDPPGDWGSPLTDHVVYYHDFNNKEISQDYWYWLTDEFENDGTWKGAQADGAPFTPANLGYFTGDTISFTLRLYGLDGVWPFYTEVKLDQDFKVHVGEEPLPTIPCWYLGDVHNHGWKTDNLYEFGDHTEGKALAAAAMGLSYVTITDHASDLTNSKWDELGNECALYSTPVMRLIRAEEMHANQGGLLDIRHLLGYGLDTFVEGAENGTYTINQILGGPTPQNNLAAQGAFAYAAHPTDPSLGWTYAEMEAALAYDTFVGLQFFNERNAHFSESDWSDDDDEYHPWGGDDSIDPCDHDWTVNNSGWEADLLQGLKHWDRLMSRHMFPVRKLFMSGGSDAHGGWNYRVYRTMSADIQATSSAMGKVRTALYLPDGLTDDGVLDALRNGRSFVTDGPAMVFGIDWDKDGEIHGPKDSLPGDGPVDVANHEKGARFCFAWNSSLEIGDVVCIRLLRGGRSTGEQPDVVWELYPHACSGEADGPLVEDLLPPPEQAFYFRAEAYTYDPAGPLPPSGDVSNHSYDAQAIDYRYRCFTNPIWVTAKEFLTREYVPW